MFFQIGGTRQQAAIAFAELASHQTGIRQLAGAKRQINAFGDQIDTLVAEDKFQLHLGMALHKFTHPLHGEVIEKISRRTPRLSSNSCKRRLMVLDGIPRRRPAAAKLPARTTWTKTAISFRSNMIHSINGLVKSNSPIY